ncbi:phenoloxidase-activating factor 1-like isoform X2 [Drosophila eugracilis]|uniref:phenoloxidase-activating factor 1-like isoform X2 n=1 Tax=Drosophila eugracilis TaxID=29029 RepID=UPI001BDAC1B3|nr:phenoloxidase-activating factor 1-like isoform X2 [Drosophila eugracilis]
MFRGSQEFYILLSLFLTSIRGQLQCGNLRESELYNRKEITGPDEYPWVGRVGYGNPENYTAEFKCVSVLIKPRYVILPAECVIGKAVTTPTFILFGDWRATDDFFQLGDCREGNGTRQCTPASQVVEIEDLIVHPGHTISLSFNYNLALAKLVRSVELSNFVQPICMPPLAKDKDNYIFQSLEITGFKKVYTSEKTWEEDDYYRQKMKVHTASLQFCNSKMLIPILMNENNLCALRDKRNLLFNGSPIMGVEVVDEKPTNFYLIGILITVISYPTSEIELLPILRVSPFRNWIENNFVD